MKNKLAIYFTDDELDFIKISLDHCDLQLLKDYQYDEHKTMYESIKSKIELEERRRESKGQ